MEKIFQCFIKMKIMMNTIRQIQAGWMRDIVYGTLYRRGSIDATIKTKSKTR